MKETRKLRTITRFFVLMILGVSLAFQTITNVRAQEHKNLATDGIDNVITEPTAIQDIFPDEVLAEYMLKYLNKESVKDMVEQVELDSILYISDAAYLIEGDSPIENLEGLQYVRNIGTLALQKLNISDISVIEHLKALSQVTLSGGTVHDLSPLRDMMQLRALVLNRHKIQDITPLKNLTNLKSLSLVGNQVSDISALGDLPQLSHLILENNNIRDIGVLRNLTKLQMLRLSQNKIHDISHLSNLTKLNQYWVTLEDQSVESEVEYTDDITFENDIKNIDASLITPSKISHDGVYEGTYVTWKAENVAGENTVTYHWEQSIPGLAGVTYSGVHTVTATKVEEEVEPTEPETPTDPEIPIDPADPADGVEDGASQDVTTDQTEASTEKVATKTTGQTLASTGGYTVELLLLGSAISVASIAIIFTVRHKKDKQ